MLREFVLARCNPPPVLESSEDDLDPVLVFVSALVVFNGFAARLAARDAWCDPLVFQAISKPIGVITPVRCPATVCLQTVSIRIDQGRISAHFLRSRRSEFARTRSLRMIAVIASFLHFPDATN